MVQVLVRRGNTVVSVDEEEHLRKLLSIDNVPPNGDIDVLQAERNNRVQALQDLRDSDSRFERKVFQMTKDVNRALKNWTPQDATDMSRAEQNAYLNQLTAILTPLKTDNGWRKFVKYIASIEAEDET